MRQHTNKLLGNSGKAEVDDRKTHYRIISMNKGRALVVTKLFFFRMPTLNDPHVL